MAFTFGSVDFFANANRFAVNQCAGPDSRKKIACNLCLVPAVTVSTVLVTVGVASTEVMIQSSLNRRFRRGLRIDQE